MRLRSPSRVSGHRSKCCRMLAGRSCADCSTRVRDRFLVPCGPQQLQHCSGNMDNTSPDTCSMQPAASSRPSVTVLQVLVAAGAGHCCWTLTLPAVLQWCGGLAT